MFDKNIRGTLVTLRPATIHDRRMIYEWLAHSDVTADMMGPPIYPEHTIPTWQDFCNDYILHYFNDDSPELGRCFVIMFKSEAVGQVNYNKIDKCDKRTELDTWMSSQLNCGKGFGPDALVTLCKYLFLKFGVLECFIKPSERNPRAIRAYEKAGFKRIALPIEELKARYGPKDSEDTVYMVKKLH